MEPVSDAVLLQLMSKADRATPGPWVASIEGRDHVSGDTVILVGHPPDRGDDMYVTRDTSPASPEDYERVAAAGTYLGALVEELLHIRGIEPQA